MPKHMKERWGIDLTGRKMMYNGWPVDMEGNYRVPLLVEKEMIYCMPGETVAETLTYFESCGGNTEELVILLNDHAFSQSIITREGLIDTTRWYTNEYYFYFIMFTKKVIGRYDFHYGERGITDIGIHHKLYEQGFYRHPIFGKFEDGSDIKDGILLNVIMHFRLLEQIHGIDTAEIKSFLSLNANFGEKLDDEFYKGEYTFCTYEYIVCSGLFYEIITNTACSIPALYADYLQILDSMNLTKQYIHSPPKKALESLIALNEAGSNVWEYRRKITNGRFESTLILRESGKTSKYYIYKRSVFQMLFTHSSALTKCFVDNLFQTNSIALPNVQYADTNHLHGTCGYYWKKKNTILKLFPAVVGCATLFFVYMFMNFEKVNNIEIAKFLIPNISGLFVYLYLTQKVKISELKEYSDTLKDTTDIQLRDIQDLQNIIFKKKTKVFKTSVNPIKINAPETISEEVWEYVTGNFSITSREKEILYHILNGLEYKQISFHLKISQNTVRNHLQNIYIKTGVKNRMELVKIFLKTHINE